jgi:hypothetical protein
LVSVVKLLYAREGPPPTLRHELEMNKRSLPTAGTPLSTGMTSLADCEVCRIARQADPMTSGVVLYMAYIAFNGCFIIAPVIG